MDFHKDMDIVSVLKVVLLYVLFAPLPPKMCNRGVFFIFAICNTCCSDPIFKILSIKHSEQLQTWQIQSQTCSGQDMLVSHRAGWKFNVRFMLFLLVTCQLRKLQFWTRVQKHPDCG